MSQTVVRQNLWFDMFMAADFIHADKKPKFFGKIWLNSEKLVKIKKKYEINKYKIRRLYKCSNNYDNWIID